MNNHICRAKRIDNDEWVQGYYFEHSDHPQTKHYILCDGFCGWGLEPPLQMLKVDPDTVGRCIGKTDKNGVDIFEEDIVYYYRFDENGVVEWDSNNAQFIVVFDNIEIDFGKVHGYDFEVIGNIFDNPKLMEE